MKKCLLIVAMGFIFLSCKKEQLPFTDTSCNCAEEVKADFEILNFEIPSWNGYENGVRTDTIYPGMMFLNVLQDDSEYEWNIEGGFQSNAKRVELNIDESWAGTNLTVHLVVNRAPETKCFPSDDGTDTVSKDIYVAPFDLTANDGLDLVEWEGDYLMKIPGIVDSVIIGLNVIAEPNLPGVPGVTPYLGITNFDGQGGNCMDSLPLRVSYRKLWAYKVGPSTCVGLSADITRPMGTNEVIMEITYDLNGGVWPFDYQTFIYRGRKL